MVLRAHYRQPSACIGLQPNSWRTPNSQTAEAGSITAYSCYCMVAPGRYGFIL